MKRQDWRRCLRVSAGSLLGAAGLLAACGSPAQERANIVELQESAFAEDIAVEAVRGDIELVSYVEAWVGPKMEQLRFEDTGTFGEYQVQLGDQVQKGDVLALPLVDDLEEAIAAKERELESLAVNYEYQKTTLENKREIARLHLDKTYREIEAATGGTPEYTALCLQAGNYDEEIKRLELQLKQLAETYELERPHCQKQLKKLRRESTGNQIRAPFDGVVVATAEAEYGDRIDTNLYYVAVADPTVTYARCESLSVTQVRSMEKIVFWKDGKEYDVSFVQRDSKFYQEMRGNPGDQFTEFQIEDPEGELAFGDYGLIRMTSAHRENVLLLPETAITSVGGVSYVYRDVDGRRQQVIVETGYKDGLMVEITAGLEEGDIVYVQGN